MAVKKIVIEINSRGDIDIEEYIDAVESACDEVEGRAMIAPETKITVQEMADG